MVMRRRPRLVPPAGFCFMVVAPQYVPLLRVERELVGGQVFVIYFWPR
jgi:hypothetical protein